VAPHCALAWPGLCGAAFLTMARGAASGATLQPGPTLEALAVHRPAGLPPHGLGVAWRHATHPPGCVQERVHLTLPSSSGRPLRDRLPGLAGGACATLHTFAWLRPASAGSVTLHSAPYRRGASARSPRRLTPTSAGPAPYRRGASARSPRRLAPTSAEPAPYRCGAAPRSPCRLAPTSAGPAPYRGAAARSPRRLAPTSAGPAPYRCGAAPRSPCRLAPTSAGPAPYRGAAVRSPRRLAPTSAGPGQRHASLIAWPRTLWGRLSSHGTGVPPAGRDSAHWPSL